VREIWRGLSWRVKRLLIVVQVGRHSGTGSDTISSTGIQVRVQVQFSGRMIQVRVDGGCDRLDQRMVNGGGERSK